MSSYSHAPWTSAYPDGLPNEITPPHNTMVEVVNAAVALSPERTAIQYFDAGLSFTELNDAAEALAAALIECGFAPGNRLALYLQNDPAFVIGLLAAWKAGGCAVMINPMNKPRELSHLLSDSGATAMLCLDTLHQSVVSEVIASGTAPALTDVVTTSARYLQTRNDVRVLIDTPLHQLPGSVMLEELLTEYRGRHPAAVPPPKPDEPAVLTYTSGTTGIPKAAVNTHGAMAFNSFTYHHWMKLSAEDCILGIAPLFHITGLVGHIGAALASRCSLILTHRFEPAVVLDAQREHRPTFTVAAVTALSSLLSCSQDPRDFESLRAVYSGGAPISPALAEDFQRATGCRIHNIYGLTETTSPALATPLGAVGRVDHRTGALSVGVPVFNTTVRVLDDDGNELPAGELGEIAIKGPQVIAAYWNRPADTAATIPNGELKTGDIGYMDDDGWFYIVDRKKDMINASGYKVWPREVEDVLYTHPAVREAAVIGVTHPYRGETVKAFVSFKNHARASSAELIDYCRDNMAAYKYPRQIEILPDLPKTNTGKILRRALRDEHATTSTTDDGSPPSSAGQTAPRAQSGPVAPERSADSLAPQPSHMDKR